ncbi:hypothetical protein [Mesorhizobium ciceri]|nr:hypothetical protein [Mesorhizobium ciceri]
MGYEDNDREKLDIRKFTLLDCLGVAFGAIGLSLFCYYGLWT